MVKRIFSIISPLLKYIKLYIKYDSYHNNKGDNMNVMTLIFRTVVIYFIVAVIFRIMGKREVGQLGTFDLVVYILIAELVALAVENKENFISNITPVFVLGILQLIIAKIAIKNEKIRNIIDGKPTLIIKNGIINFKNMLDQRYTLDDLLLQLREKDVRSIDEVEYAILETNGKLSVFKKDDQDKNIFPLPIILDGKVQLDNLYYINKNKKWLDKILINKRININDVFYAFSKNNDLYIIKNNEVINKEK